MLEEKKYIDKIELVKGCIQVREVTIVLKDGKKIASNLHRTVYSKEDDISNADPLIKAIGNLLWSTDLNSSFNSDNILE